VTKGYLAVILHAHLPFVRHPEHEESLEENWFYEAITETYLPLLLMMDRLIDEGVGFRLTFSVTPTLASMLSDPFLQDRYLGRLESLIELGKREKVRTGSQPRFQSLAGMYLKHLRNMKEAFINRYDRDLPGAFRRIQDLGMIDVIGSSATHAYLPLHLGTPSAVRAQIRLGVESYRRSFGRSPRGFWLPECGYYPGAGDLLAEEGVRYTILETHGITRAQPRPRYGIHAPLYSPSGMAFFGRDPDSSRQVWSSGEGYPGDFDYREFYRDIAYDLEMDYIGPFIHRDGIRIDTGFKYYRITGKTDRKEVYIPERAAEKADLHARDFLSKKERQVMSLTAAMDRKPLVVAPYDAELFGHWWFEGPLWLESLIRHAAARRDLRLITPSEYLQEYPVNQVASPSSSSWGHRGFSETWLNTRNDWIYRHLNQAAVTMERLAAVHPQAEGLRLRALNQAARELLLAQASDWAFIMNAGTTVEYAVMRTKTHLQRFMTLTDQIEKGRINSRKLKEMESQDNIFPEMDYRVFA
jgi:1,4-alpha-glucan branching enzyme